MKYNLFSGRKVLIDCVTHTRHFENYNEWPGLGNNNGVESTQPHIYIVQYEYISHSLLSSNKISDLRIVVHKMC